MSTLAFVALFGGLGAPELIIILIIVLLLFGAGRIKNVMRELGGGIAEFKKGMREGDQPTAKPNEVNKDTSKINPN